MRVMKLRSFGNNLGGLIFQARVMPPLILQKIMKYLCLADPRNMVVKSTKSDPQSPPKSTPCVPSRSRFRLLRESPNAFEDPFCAHRVCVYFAKTSHRVCV